MADIGTTKTWTIEYEGLSLQIVATENGDGTSSFDITCLEGYADLNALYWGDETDDGDSVTLKGSLNMNGTEEDWDGVDELSSTGLKNEGTDKETYVTAGETYSVDSVDVSFDELFTVGLRATSTSTDEGSIKGVDSDPVLGPDHFPEWFGPDGGPAISQVTIYFEGDTPEDPYAVQFDYTTGFGDLEFQYSNDLDNDFGKLLDQLVTDGKIAEEDKGNVDGTMISGGYEEVWYDLDNDPNDNDEPPFNPGDVEVDDTYVWSFWDDQWTSEPMPA